MARHPYAAVLAVAACLAPAIHTPLRAQEPNQSVRVSTFTVKVEKVDPSTRSLIVVDEYGVRQGFSVAKDVALYDELAVGDLIVVDYIDEIVVALKPGASLTTFEDTTEAARAEPQGPGVRVEQRLKAVVTIDSIDASARAVVYHGKDNRRVLRMVPDPALLKGLEAGDVVEITFTRARAVGIVRAPR
jgi:hypothetical protein